VLNAFRTTAELLARRFAGKLSSAEIADRLDAKATTLGLDEKYGRDAIQKILTEAVNVSFDMDDESALDDDVRPPAYSDEALALIFAKRHGEQLKYVAQWGKWLIWTGTRWAFDETLKVVDLARHVCREVASRCGDDRVARAVASRKAVSAVLSLARADQRISAMTEDWDRDPWLLNTPSGVVDLRSGKQRPHTPDDYLTKITAVAPASACPIPLWEGFVQRVTGGDVEYINFLKRVCGYCLTGLTSEHALFFLYGTGANGKSTFISTITGCFGDHYRAAPIETFTAGKNDRHPTELAGLRGARLVTAVETEENRHWAESRLKSLTGGDKVPARFMRQDWFEYWPIFKLLIAGNHKPGLRTVDEAIRRRLHLLPFTQGIPKEERDPRLPEKLKAEWSGILAWMIEGCLEWQGEGLNPPDVVTVATREYFEEEDSLAVKRHWNGTPYRHPKGTPLIDEPGR
jgi:putative DNA primase/helicase